MKKIFLVLTLVLSATFCFAGGLECQINGTCQCQMDGTCDEDGNPIQPISTQICGDTTRAQIAKSSFILTIQKSMQTEEIVVLVTSQKSKDFLGHLSVSGPLACGIVSSPDAPFEVCFFGNPNTYTAARVYCGKKPICTGDSCGSMNEME